MEKGILASREVVVDPEAAIKVERVHVFDQPLATSSSIVCPTKLSHPSLNQVLASRSVPLTQMRTGAASAIERNRSSLSRSFCSACRRTLKSRNTRTTPAVASRVNDRRRAVVDWCLRAISRDKESVVRQANHTPGSQDLLDGIFNCNASVLMENLEHVRQQLALASARFQPVRRSASGFRNVTWLVVSVTITASPMLPSVVANSSLSRASASRATTISEMSWTIFEAPITFLFLSLRGETESETGIFRPLLWTRMVSIRSIRQALSEAIEDFGFFVQPVRRNKQCDRFANDLFSRIAEESLCSRIPALDNCIEVFGDNRVSGELHDRRKVRALFV